MNYHNGLTKILACPSCKGNISATDEAIICNNCRRTYYKKNGIYKMLIDKELDEYDKEQELLFDKIYNKYDHYLNAQPFYISIKKNYVYPYWFQNNFKDKVVLDIGCGTGWGGKKILEQCSLLVNLDIAFNNLLLAKEKLGERGAVYVQADMKRLPFCANTFDIVTCFWSLHHIEKIETVVREIRDILVDDGIFLGVEPNEKYSWVDFWNDLFNIPFPIRRSILKLHKKIQKYTHRRLEKEESYMKGIDLKYDYHAGLRGIEEYKSIFANLSFQFEYKPAVVEIVPPRLFMYKNKTLVNFLLKLSNFCIKHLEMKNKGMYSLIRAVKNNAQSYQ